MKKYINFLLWMMLLAACQDYRYDEMVNNSTYFTKSDLQDNDIYIMDDEDYIYNIWMYKSGYFSDMLAGELELDYNYLVQFNTQKGTNYEMLDQKYYSFEREFRIEEGEIETSIPLVLKTAQLIKDYGYDKTFYIPVGIKSLTKNVQPYDEKSHLLLAFRLKQATLQIDSDFKGEVYHDFSQEDWKEFDFDITTVLNTGAQKECRITYSLASDLLPAGKEMLDKQYYTFASSVSLPVGEKFAENYLTLNVEGMPDGEWVVPIKITIDKPNVKVEDTQVIFTVVKGAFDIKWNTQNMLEDKLVFGPNIREHLVVGTYSTEDVLEIRADKSWIQPVLKNGKVEITVEKYAGNDPFRTAHITIQKANMTESIEVVQYASEDLNPKNKWSIEPGNNKTTATNTEPFKNIIDGNIDTRWQWGWGQSGLSDFPNTPYEFIIDFGSEQIFNMISLWQTQKATNGYVKDVQFKVSSDKATWIDAGKYRMSASTDEAKAYGNNPYNYNLPATFKARYVRLIILSNVGDSGVNYFKNAYLGEFSAFLK